MTETPDPAAPKVDRPRLPDEFEERLKDTDQRAARVYTELEKLIADLEDED